MAERVGLSISVNVVAAKRRFSKADGGSRILSPRKDGVVFIGRTLNCAVHCNVRCDVATSDVMVGQGRNLRVRL